MSENYYGEEGCCLTCEDAEEGCLCAACKCTQCEWYEKYDYMEGGHCLHERPSDYWTWKDWEDEAKRTLSEVQQKFAERQVLLKALFSNGTQKCEIFYFNIVDIPHKIPHFFKDISRTRIVLLKNVTEEKTA